MALGFSAVKRFKPKYGIRRGIIDITLDSSYNSGGWAISAANLGLNNVILDLHVPPFKAGFGFEWAQAAGKLKAYKQTGTAAAMQEIASSDANTLVIRCEYIGY